MADHATWFETIINSIEMYVNRLSGESPGGSSSGDFTDHLHMLHFRHVKFILDSYDEWDRVNAVTIGGIRFFSLRFYPVDGAPLESVMVKVFIDQPVGLTSEEISENRRRADVGEAAIPTVKQQQIGRAVQLRFYQLSDDIIEVCKVIRLAMARFRELNPRVNEHEDDTLKKMREQNNPEA